MPSVDEWYTKSYASFQVAVSNRKHSIREPTSMQVAEHIARRIGGPFGNSSDDGQRGSGKAVSGDMTDATMNAATRDSAGGDGVARPNDLAILRLDHIRKQFGEAEILRGVSLSVKAGEVLSIIGASGSGKSTLLRCVNLFELPSSGEIFFENKLIEYGTSVPFWRRERILRTLRRNVGMVFQSYNLWPHMTVLENVMEAPVRTRQASQLQAREKAERLLAKI